MPLTLLLPASRQFRLTGGRFYNGGKRENGILSRAYDQVAKHVHTVFKVRKFLYLQLIDADGQARIPYG
jgi:hypothetical protein